MRKKPVFTEVIEEILLTLMYKTGFKAIGFGSTRAVFAHKNLVYKIPMTPHPYHLESMYVEDFASRNANKEGMFTWSNEWGTEKTIKVPKCRLIHIKGVPVLIMEKLVPCHIPWEERREYPWLSDLDSTHDGLQIGKDRNGVIKTMDYGHILKNIENYEFLREKAKQTASIFKHLNIDKCYDYCEYLQHELMKLGFSESIGVSFNALKEKQEVFAFT